MTVEGGKSLIRKSFKDAAEKPEDFLRLLILLNRFAKALNLDGPDNLDDSEAADPAQETKSELELLIEEIFPDYEASPDSVPETVRDSISSLRSFAGTSYHSRGEMRRGFHGVVSNFANNIDETGMLAPIRTHLLNTISGPESGGRYDVGFGGRRYDLENMTINQVRNLQKQIVAAGGPSSAMGRYQIMGYTLDTLLGDKKLGLTGNEKFDRHTQDRLGIALADRREHLSAFLAGDPRMTAERFANNLAHEWMGLKDSSGRGTRDGDGLNHGTLENSTLVSSLNRLGAAVGRPGEFQNAVLHTKNIPGVVVEGTNHDTKLDPTTRTL